MIPAGLNVDQTVAYAADQFEIELNDSQPYLDGVTAAAVATGLLDPYFAPDFVQHVSNGVVDEVELHVQPNRIGVVVRGRDIAALAADSVVNVVYSVDPAQPATPEVPLAIPGFPTMPVIEGVTVPAIVHSTWTARSIAEDLCRRVGVGLVWDTNDYRMREDFSVNGSVFDAIQQLVEPFSHFERSKVDIWAEGDTLIVRKRRAPAVAPLQVSAHDLRVTNLSVRDKYLDLIRVLRLTGSRTGRSGVAVDPGDTTRETTDEIVDPLTDEVISRVVTTEVVRQLDGAVRSQIIETFQDAFNDQGTRFPMALVSRKTTSSDWDDLVLTFPNQIVNSPRENSNVCTEEGWNPSASGGFGGLANSVRTTVSHAYDSDGFLSAQHTKKEVWDDTPTASGPTGWVLDEAETKQYRRNGTQTYQIRTTRFDSSGSPTDVRRTTAAGVPPGGPGRSTFGRGGSSLETVTYAAVISLEPRARDFSMSNANLLDTDLAVIAAEARASSGATEHEVSFTAAGLPWVHRGQYIEVVDLFAEDGVTPIPIGPALVTEARFEYREGPDGGSPSYLTFVKALWWTGGA